MTVPRRSRRGAARGARLRRRSSRAACGRFDNVAIGFAAISPVVGLYAVVLVGTLVAGPAWVWVLPVALAGQCLLLCVYAELASEFPIAGGAYQWSRRLIGGAYGWFSGWVAICAYAVANTTIAYLGAPWALTLFGIERDARPRSSRRAWCSSSSARSPARSASTCSAARSRSASRPRRSPRSGSGSRCCSPSASRTGRCSARHARRRGLVGRLGRRGHAGRARGRRLGLHRLRRLRERRRGDAGRRPPRAAHDLDRAAQRRRARDPQRGRGRPRAPGSRRRRRRRGPRPGHHGGRLELRLLVDPAVRGSRPHRLPRLRDRGADAHRAHDLLDRARRRAAGLRGSFARSTAAAPRSGRSSRRPSPPASACCSACTRRRSAA